MKTAQFVSLLLAVSPMQWVFRMKHRNRIRVLCYHDVADSANFERQILYLKKSYRIITVQELERHIYQRAQLPENAVLITFDDGDETLLRVGLPVLQRHAVPFVIFVVTALINTRKPYWWFEVGLYAGASAKAEVNRLKRVTTDARVAAIEKMRMENGWCAVKQQFTLSDCSQVEQNGGTIANHSHTHPILPQCTPEQLQEEFSKSGAFFRANPFSGAAYFAYPNGDYDPAVLRHMEQHGFRLGFAFNHRLFQRKDGPFSISRLSVDSTTDLSKFQLILSGFHSFLLHTFKK